MLFNLPPMGVEKAADLYVLIAARNPSGATEPPFIFAAAPVRYADEYLIQGWTVVSEPRPFAETDAELSKYAYKRGEFGLPEATPAELADVARKCAAGADSVEVITRRIETQRAALSFAAAAARASSELDAPEYYKQLQHHQQALAVTLYIYRDRIEITVNESP